MIQKRSGKSARITDYLNVVELDDYDEDNDGTTQGNSMPAPKKP